MGAGVRPEVTMLESGASMSRGRKRRVFKLQERERVAERERKFFLISFVLSRPPDNWMVSAHIESRSS